METQAESNSGDDISAIKELRQQLENRIEIRHKEQENLISSLQTLVPDLVCSLNLSLQVISTFNGRSFTPLTPNPNPNPNPNTPRSLHLKKATFTKQQPPSSTKRVAKLESRTFRTDEESSGNPMLVVRSMVAACLLERVPFSPIDSSTVLRKLENDESIRTNEKQALQDVGGESGAILAVEMGLRSMGEDNGSVELEEFVVSGKSRVMVMNIDRMKLTKELPESNIRVSDVTSNKVYESEANGAGMAVMPRGGIQEVWNIGPGDPHMQGMPPMFPGPMMGGPRGGPGPRGMGMMGMHRGMGMPPHHRPPPFGSNGSIGVLNAGVPVKQTSEEDVMKDLEALLNKKSFKEMQKSKTGEELLDLIHRPTARETMVAAKFKTKGGPQLKEYCAALTKEDCRHKSGSYIACEKVHFRRIIAPHTDINLGDCSFLDTCRHMKTCKYVHYELDPTPDVSPMMGTVALPPSRPLKAQRAHYCSEVELGEPQWINCDIRNFRMDILGQFGVIMADPPWDIHMELPYGTMGDEEMRTLNVPALQTDGLIFLWVTGRAMELGRECLESWGYKRVEEIIWVKTNQLQRIIRTGRTGHWLNHSKEHCLVGIKGNPEVNRNIDTDVIVAEVRETSRKPDEMYPLLERISPRTRKLELFARMHNTHAGWLSLGNQLNGVRLVDEGLRGRFKAAYPDIEIQPPSPPRSSAMEVDGSGPEVTTPFSGPETKFVPQSFTQAATAEAAFVAEEKPLGSQDVEMVKAG
ncbi:N6-adenosine-methyltransferase MT-A70-like [Amaranthus tricolor]|uniref:N6-adenosine-methyltransferase MT-A70-like n=1 Tax=Amaranthus tricolor TaxID=29722 RepID=UPI0025858978|nr:N6-adenosine-methyltransferase MT-A70-like [Amaranthus tricolor]